MVPTGKQTRREDHARRFLMLQKALAKQFRAALPEDARQEMGEVTVHQMEAMGVIARNGPVTMSELAAAMGSTSMSAMTQLADRLVRLGLVERQSDPNDRRVVRLTLSEGARATVSRYMEAHRGAVVEAFDAFTDEELETFMGLVEKLAASSEPDCASPA